jgi:hypothetical protein
MKKSHLVVVVVLTIAGISAVAAIQRAQAISTLQKVPAQVTDKSSENIPDEIFYGETFLLLAKLKNISDYKTAADLNDVDAGALLTLAEQCEKDIQDLDAQAQKLIVALHDNSNGKPAQENPRPPRELIDLQVRRDETILKYRSLVQQRLGEAQFQRFNDAAKKIVRITISPRR